jgi:protein-S-isoprenylcysteine O-methyltransferase Ste14
MEASHVTIRHPNREKAESKATKAIVVLLLLASAGLVAIITFGGWSALQGAQFVAIAAIIIYLLMAYYVARWNRGVLPVASGLAILMAVLAAIAAPAWFDRDKAGLHNPALPPSLLGTLCIVLVPVSLFLIAFAMRGFTQEWHVEVEEHSGTDAGDATQYAV